MLSENKEQLCTYIKLIEQKLFSYNAVNESNKTQKNVIEAMNYSLSAGGKRIRPVLMLEFCRLCGGDINSALSAAAAIEMVHTFSLIHDDLPCMDNDDLRRGKPSCHKKYGEAIALLAGDALENLAFYVIADSKELTSEVKIKLIKELSVSVGVEGMIGGQIIDMENEYKSINKKTLNKMYSCKTGALIKAACKMGCIIGNANCEQLYAAEVYAKKLGLAFQIIDDILDVIGNENVLGKPIGSDKEQNKTTYVTLYGLEESKKIAEALTNDALTALNKFTDNRFVVDLTKSLVVRKN